MDLVKIFEKDLAGKGVLGQPDVPGLSAEEMQRKIEEIVRDVAIVKINEIIEWLCEEGATKEDLHNLAVEAGTVTSVFGRRGAVVAQKGDYSPEMIGAAKEKHAEKHLPGGDDAIDIALLGGAEKEHTHGNIGAKGNIGSTNGKIVVTGVGGVLEAKSKEEAGLLTEPVIVATSGEIAVTVENHKEYEYTGVTSLAMNGSNANCHGFVVFGDSAPVVSVYGFSAALGDDITSAAANETWEFSCFGGKVIWVNWGVI